MNALVLFFIFSQWQNSRVLASPSNNIARTQLAQSQNKHHKQKLDPMSEARVLRRLLCTRAAALLQPTTTTKRRLEERGEHCKLTWKTATRSDQFHAVSLQGFPAQISLVQPPEVVGCLENRKVTESQCASILTLVVNFNQLVVSTIKPTWLGVNSSKVRYMLF